MPEFLLVVVVFVEHRLTVGESSLEFLNDGVGWNRIGRLGDKEVGPTFGV